MMNTNKDDTDIASFQRGVRKKKGGEGEKGLEKGGGGAYDAATFV